MESEIFELIQAFNRLKEKVIIMNKKIDDLKESIANSPSRELSEIYVDEARACEILHVRPRILSDLRKRIEIPFIKHHRKIVYPIVGLYAYLEKYCTSL